MKIFQNLHWFERVVLAFISLIAIVLIGGSLYWSDDTLGGLSDFFFPSASVEETVLDIAYADGFRDGLLPELTMADGTSKRSIVEVVTALVQQEKMLVSYGSLVDVYEVLEKVLQQQGCELSFEQSQNGQNAQLFATCGSS